MPVARLFSQLSWLPGFERGFKKLPPDIKAQATEAIQDLLKDPIPGRLQFKKLQGYRNPSVYTITITRNHAYKASLEVKDGVGILRRIGTHKQIDDLP